MNKVVTERKDLTDVGFKGSVWFDDEWMPITETTDDYLKAYWEGYKIILEKIDNSTINAAIEAIVTAWKNGNRVFVFGNGGSAGNASHFAADLMKTTMSPGKPRIKAICLNDNMSVLSAWTNDEGWGSVYEGQLENYFEPGDVCIALSVHGGSMSGNSGSWSQNLMRGLEYSKKHGGVNIGIAGWNGGGFVEVCDHTIVIPLDSTMHVEAGQMIVHHAIVGRLQQIIKQHSPSPNAKYERLLTKVGMTLE
ncbi:SIS domain-containing protein, partial [Candidatus Woesearchaeota archaeon]|nr:SIS domain-containing protein [Candidatus Woesearchaeota archaeon]